MEGGGEALLIGLYRQQADHFRSMARMADRPLRERLIALADDYEALVDCMEARPETFRLAPSLM